MHPLGFRFCLLIPAASLILALSGNQACAQTASGNGNGVTQTKANDPKEITPELSQTPPAASPFQFDIGIPAWASAINGTVGIKGVSGTVNETFTSLWDHMDWVAPLAADVRYQKWGFHLDGQIVQLSETLNTRDILYLSGTVKMQQAFANFNVNYQVLDTERWKVNTSFGGRYNYLSLSGNLQSRFPALLPNKDETGSTSWVDPILGVDATVHVYKPLSLEMLGDVGGFGVGSHITYQFYGGAKVQMTRNLHMDVGYRYLYTNYSESGNTYNVDMKGPQLSFGANF